MTQPVVIDEQRAQDAKDAIKLQKAIGLNKKREAAAQMTSTVKTAKKYAAKQAAIIAAAPAGARQILGIGGNFEFVEVLADDEVPVTLDASDLPATGDQPVL